MTWKQRSSQRILTVVWYSLMCSSLSCYVSIRSEATTLFFFHQKVELYLFNSSRFIILTSTSVKTGTIGILTLKLAKTSYATLTLVTIAALIQWRYPKDIISLTLNKLNRYHCSVRSLCSFVYCIKIISSSNLFSPTRGLRHFKSTALTSLPFPMTVNQCDKSQQRHLLDLLSGQCSERLLVIFKYCFFYQIAF